MGRLSVTDLARDPGELARELPEWARGEPDEAVLLTLDVSARNLHARGYTCWVWTGRTPAGEPAWALPVTARAAREFAPKGPARVLAQLLAAAVDAGAAPEAVLLLDWRGVTCLVLPGLDEEIAAEAIEAAHPPPARAAVAALPDGVALDGEPIPLLPVDADDGGVAELARATHVHPVRVILALAGHGQPVDEETYPPELVPALREWGCDGTAPPPPEPSYAIEDDPCPRRRHARKVLQRLHRMGKIGDQHHTEFDHLYRGVAPHQRRDALEVGEAFIRAGLLGEKPSVGQRHVYLRREALREINALIERGETGDPALAALWTAPPPGEAGRAGLREGAPRR
jgi:hypothetical protein